MADKGIHFKKKPKRSPEINSSFLKWLFTIILTGFYSFSFSQTITNSHVYNDSTVNYIQPTRPVIVGSVIGNNGIHIETIFSKPLTSTSRFGVFGLADLYGVYKTKEQTIKNQQMAQTQITFKLIKDLNVSAGAFFENHSGFRPTIGLQYNLFISDFHLLLAPRLDLSQTYNGELLGFAEYSPPIKVDWKAYTRIQGLYNRDLKNGLHSISYIWGRIGVSYKNFRFGLGNNFYWVGPGKIKENNFGLFLGVILF